jgi:uncharacterized protein (DUF302 family)
MRLFDDRTAATVAVLAALALQSAPAHAAPIGAADEGPGVYLKLAESVPLSVDEAAQALEDALLESGWNVATRMDCGVDASACDFRSHVIVAYTDAHVDRLMAYGVNAAFAVPIRFVVWEDEGGVHVGSTNPMNLNRTIVDEESQPDHWADIAKEIRDVAAVAFPESLVSTEYGQARPKARIGRTMGIMAGGKFEGKVEHVLDFKSTAIEPPRLADVLATQMGSVAGEWDWGTKAVYVIDFPEQNAALVGVSGSRIESKSFDIVASGGIDTRKDLACPGIDHAAAYPIEVLISRDGDNIRISLVDEMYRMKMFFEDAGKMAFAKNMAMPGSIEDEIKDKIKAIF